MKWSLRPWQEIVIVTLGYAIAAAVMTYPLLFQLHSGLVSHSSDVWILAWDNWWIQHALSSGQNIFYTTFMFFPSGVSLASHSFSFTHTLISTLLQLFTDATAAYNLAIWLIFPIAGLGMYWLARYVTRSRLAAWVAGLIFAFAPYHMTQALGHPHLSYVQFIPFAVLFILKTIESPRPRYIVGAIVALVLTAYAGPHILVVTLTWLVVFLPFELIAQRRRLQRSVLLALSGILIGTLLLSLPLVLPAVSDIVHGQSAQELQTGDFDNTQTDALALLLPTRYHPIFGPSLAETYRDLGKNNQWMPYLGWLALLLSIVGVLTQRRRSISWLISGLACLILALGAQLLFDGVTYPVPLPFALLQNIFPFSFLRSPDRFNIIVSLPLAMLVAFGLASILQRFASSAARITIAALASLVILFEYLSVPYPMMPLPETSPFLLSLAHDNPPSAVLDLPMGRNPSKLYLYFQMQHQQPLVEGHVSRTPARAYEFIEANAALRALRSPDQSSDVPPAAWQVLSQAGIRYIIIHLTMTNANQLQQYRAILDRPPIYADPLLEVYAATP
ncbi:MAG TPA: 6-pyruvoyl-tetrahydropterin synthase-related protein [Anaerolineae bacterium]|nr:6-pyruvoyl-tetrahydropterin synthase-related protein [Anaerolineae bacterium]